MGKNVTKPDFDRSIHDQVLSLGRPMLAAHRGVSTANIPCNTLEAFRVALDQGADIVEIDVATSLDGVKYVFHPKLEPVFLGSKRLIAEMDSAEVDAMKVLNQDHTPTSYGVPRLAQVLELFKGRAYINVDKYWRDIPGITAAIREAGVERQVIVKCQTTEDNLKLVREYAPDLMFMPLIDGRMSKGCTKTPEDLLSELLALRDSGINVVGVEALFDREDCSIISKEFVDALHAEGMFLWTNSIVYDETAVLSAYHWDDVAAQGDPAQAWGWLAARGADVIQTDWLLAARMYFGDGGWRSGDGGWDRNPRPRDPNPRPQDTITATSEGRTFLIKQGAVYYAESVDKRTYVYTKEGCYETKERLYELEESLGNYCARVSKSMVINLKKVKFVKSELGGRMVATMLNDEEVVVSRNYVKDIKRRLGL